MAWLEAKNLSFTYPGACEPALRNIDFSLERGSFTVLCGLSGCGKSTLLRLLKPSSAPHGVQSGTCTVEGKLLSSLSLREDARTVGFVGQDPEAGIVTDTLGHELAFALESLGEDPAFIRRRTAEAAAFFGRHQPFDTPVQSLSGGQKQLLALAAAMVLSPRLLLLDEPTAQLDPVAASKFIAVLQKLNREFGTTILLSEHRLEEVFPIADRVLVMDHGTVAAMDAPSAAAWQTRTLPIAQGYPAAARVFAALEPADSREDPPVIVRDGRAYLEKKLPAAVSLPPEPPVPAPGKPAVQWKDVYFRYEKNAPDVLHGLRLELYTGEIHALLGANGGGKSTCLKLLTGRYRPYLGQVRLFGKPMRDPRGTVAYLPQDPKLLFSRETLWDELAETAPSPQAASDLAERFGLTPLLRQHPFDLSGGEQQRAALAKLLLRSPGVFLLDEPTKGLDAAAKATLAACLRELTAGGCAVLVVTHDVEFAAAYAQRCSLFFAGEVIDTKPPRLFFSGSEFYTTAANRMARDTLPYAVTCGDIIAACDKHREGRG